MIRNFILAAVVFCCAAPFVVKALQAKFNPVVACGDCGGSHDTDRGRDPRD